MLKDIPRGHGSPTSKLMIDREGDGCQSRCLAEAGMLRLPRLRETIKLAHQRGRQLPMDFLACNTLIRQIDIRQQMSSTFQCLSGT